MNLNILWSLNDFNQVSLDFSVIGRNVITANNGRQCDKGYFLYAPFYRRLPWKIRSACTEAERRSGGKLEEAADTERHRGSERLECYLAAISRAGHQSHSTLSIDIFFLVRFSLRLKIDSWPSHRRALYQVKMSIKKRCRWGINKTGESGRLQLVTGRRASLTTSPLLCQLLVGCSNWLSGRHGEECGPRGHHSWHSIDNCT